MATVIPTHQVDVTDTMVYFEEPTPGANPNSITLIPVPLISSMNKTESWRNDVRYVLGKVDRHAVLKSKKENNFSITYDLYNTTMFRYGTELAGGTGTIEKTLTFILPIKLNGSTYYKRFKGCITDTVSISVEEYYTVDHSFIAQYVTEYMTADELKLDLGLSTTATLSWPAFPTDIQWTNLKPSATTQKPLTINGTAYYMLSLEISVERGPTAAEATANESFFYIKSGYRKVSGSVSLYLHSKDIDTLLRNFTSFTMTYKLSDSPACDITLANTVITSIEDGLEAGENSYVMLDCSIDNGSFTVTAVA